mgnify:CR=1 FL=1
MVKGFIVEHSAVPVDGKTFVQLFGRTESGESFVVMNEFSPYFYIEKSFLDDASEALNEFGAKVEDSNLKSFAGKQVSKVSFELQAELNKCRHELHTSSIDTFEADLKPSFRFLLDNNIFTSIEIEGDAETGELVDRVYWNPEISPVDFRPKLKILSLDIETGKNGELFCIGLYSEKYKKCFVSEGKESKKDFVVSCKDEEELLEKFKEEFLDFDPDIVTGWNVIDFDFDFLRGLFDKYKIKFNLGRTNEKSKLKVESNFFKNSSLKISGRQVLDGLNFIKDPYIRDSPTIKSKNFENFTLDAVASEMVGDGKLLKGKQRHEEIIDFFNNDIDKLIDYNIQDCKLVYDILEKSAMIDLAIERAELTGMTLDRVGSSILSFDSLYIREATKRGSVSPTQRYSEKENGITGGFVMSPASGIYDNVLVFDFKSLYPSIIRTFNIDPLSFSGVGSVKETYPIGKKPSKAKTMTCLSNGACFENTDGVLPSILSRLHIAREKAKKEKREFSSYAIKIIMNSFFGVMASPNCRYFNMDVANAITTTGQELIKKTQDMIGAKGYSITYGDTDSIFVDSGESEKDSLETGKRIEKEINEFYDKYIQDKYNRKSYLELEFEKLYLNLLIPAARGVSVGAKKRYAGLRRVDGKEDLEIVGLEAIRGDWTEAAGDFQRELLMRVFHKEDFRKFIQDFAAKLKSGEMNEKLVYRKQLRKAVDEYTKTTPPHVKAARKLKVVEGNLIEYFVTTDGPEPRQELKHKLDYEHYIDKQIKPVANSILGLLDCSFEEILRGNKQTTLFGF